MADVVLLTGRDMPRPEVETSLLVTALQARGIEAVIEPWGLDAALDGRLVVVRTTWDYPPYRDEFIGWLRQAAAATRLVNPVDILEWNSHKSYLLDLAYAAVPVIPTALVPKAASAAERRAALEEYEGEVVIKPAVSAGAIGTLLAGALSAEADDHLRSLTESADALVQPFEPEVVDGEVSLIYFGGEFSHAVRKIPAEGEYRVQVRLGGTIETHVATTDELETATLALAAVTADLAYARVDLVATPRGPAVMELELIEPQLFLDEHEAAPERFADHLATLLS